MSAPMSDFLRRINHGLLSRRELLVIFGLGAAAATRPVTDLAFRDDCSCPAANPTDGINVIGSDGQPYRCQLTKTDYSGITPIHTTTDPDWNVYYIQPSVKFKTKIHMIAYKDWNGKFYIATVHSSYGSDTNSIQSWFSTVGQDGTKGSDKTCILTYIDGVTGDFQQACIQAVRTPPASPQFNITTVRKALG
jgi:hypothetical protein